MRHKTNPQEHQRLRRLLRIRQISAKGRLGRSNLSTLSWFSLDKRKKKRKPGKSNWGWFKRNKALYEGEHARPTKRKARKVKPVVEQVADALQVVPRELKTMKLANGMIVQYSRSIVREQP